MMSFSAKTLHPYWMALIPFLFVLLWSTGFIGAKFGLPYVEPFTFLALRFVLVLCLLIPLSWLMQTNWNYTPIQVLHIAVVGLLVHSLYLGGVFAAIDDGMPAGLSSLIAGTQPLLAAFIAGPMLSETVSRRQWFGLVLGLCGVVLVLGEKLAASGDQLFSGFGVYALAMNLLALICITFGTLYQKRFCTHMGLVSGSIIQYSAALLLTGALAFMFETRVIIWHTEFIFAITWLVMVLSLGAVSLLLLLIRHGSAASVASLFYLVPPATAIEAWLLFDEQVGPLAVGGIVMVMIAVFIVIRGSEYKVLK